MLGRPMAFLQQYEELSRCLNAWIRNARPFPNPRQSDVTGPRDNAADISWRGSWDRQLRGLGNSWLLEINKCRLFAVQHRAIADQFNIISLQHRPYHLADDRSATDEPAMTTSIPRGFVDEIEDALESGSAERSADVVLRVTDLFLAGAETYSAEHIALFDELLSRLAGKIEASARAELSLRISNTDNAPPNLIRKLALDDAVKVASPVLKFSNAVDEKTLVDCARQHSQAHLFAISRRRVLQEPVTDVLVERGESAVLQSLAINEGSRFSSEGYSRLVQRAEGNDVLATELAHRQDLPRQLFLRLLETASSHVQEKLKAQNQHSTDDIEKVVSQVAEKIAIKTSENAKSYTEALAHVSEMHAAKKLGEPEIQGFIARHELERLIAALALLADVDIVTVEAAMLQRRTDRLLVIGKAINLGWPTVKSLLQYSVGGRALGPEELEKARKDFDRISRDMAKQVMAFQR